MRKYFQRIKEAWKLVLLLFLIMLTFSYAMFQGGFVSWFLFYSFLPFALYALCLAFYPVNDFKVERMLAHREFNTGEKINVVLTIKRNNSFPLLYVIVEEGVFGAPSAMGKIGWAKEVYSLGSKREFNVHYTIERLPRGEHQFEGVRIKTGDFFGLIEKERLIVLEDKILVYPSYEDMNYRSMLHQFDEGTTAANERVHRDTSMSVGIREYQPGDRFSWINWKATAKRNDFMTKEFEQQRKSHDVLVIMDCTLDLGFEAVVSFTASITRAVLRQGAQVSLLTLGAERVMLPTRGGDVQQRQIFYHLAKIQSQSNDSFGQLLEREVFLGNQHHSLMIVTAKFTENLLDKVSPNSKKNGSYIIFLVKRKLEPISKVERNFITAARSRGIIVKIVHEGHFAETFSEVMGG